jgi:hypothetical protein
MLRPRQIHAGQGREESRRRVPGTRRSVVGPHAIAAKGRAMKGLAFVMAALLVLATTLAFGVAVA